MAAADTVTYTALGQTAFPVPPGVTGLYVTAVGARGGQGAAGGSPALGGLGGVARAVLAVTPGQTLYAEVGGVGGPGSNQNPGSGGLNGGGAGGAGGLLGFTAGGGGGGGGGAADVRTTPIGAFDLNSRLITAPGGGGGGGATITGPGSGVGGGGGLGGGGGSSGTAPCGGVGGGGGTPPPTAFSGGTGGASTGAAGPGGTGGFGSGGFGGPFASDGSGGGGAGAGWYGGGGGGGTDGYCKGGGGGGGGSVHFGAGTSDTSSGTAASDTASVSLNYLPPSVVTSDVVISQVYGGGETVGQGAPYQRDFIELFNRGGAPVDLNGWAVQYASATGSAWSKTDLVGVVVPAGGHVLVAESAAAGPDGAPLPTPDATGSIGMSQTAAKVALTDTTTTLSGVCPARNAQLRDFVAYGQAATCFEGASQAAELNAVTSGQRAGSGCTDSDSNSADFPSAGTPAPRNSASPVFDCSTPNAAVAASCGPALTAPSGAGASRDVSAVDPDGRVTAFTHTVLPAPSAGGITLSSQTPAAAAGGTANTTLTVAPATPSGVYDVTVTASNDDGAAQQGSCSLTVTVESPPDGGGGSAPPPGAGPPSDPAAPQVSGVTSPLPAIAGRPALLSAQVSGTARRLDWDLNGNGTTDVVCPGNQPTLRFRAGAITGTRGGSFDSTVTVRAIGSGGESSAFSQQLAVAPARPAATGKLGAALGRVDALAKKRPPVFACGLAADAEAAGAELTNNFALPKHPSLLPSLLNSQCLNRTLSYAPVLRVSGCFAPIRSEKQIPEAELGSLKPLLDVGKVSLSSESAGKFVEAGLDFTDAFISTDAVLVNGVKLDPQGDAVIVVFPQVQRIFSSNAAMSVGGVKLEHPPKFSLNISPSGANAAARIPLGSFVRLPGGLSALAGFGLTGNVDVVLTPGTASAPGGAEISAQLELPDFLDVVPGVSASGNVKFLLANDGEFVLQNLKIGPIDAAIGPLGISDLSLEYTRGTTGEFTHQWKGMGKLCVAIACLDATEVPGEAPPGGVLIRDGQLVRIYANLAFPDPGITLFPGIQLNRIGAGIGLNPTRLLGGVRVTAAGVFEIDGTLVLAFPSAGAPFTLTREEAGGAFREDLYTRKYERFVLAAGGTAYLKVPVIPGRLELGGAYLLYHAPGYVAFGGGFDYSFFDVISITGLTHGEVNFESGRFNLIGQVRACLVDIICRGATGVVSSIGAGGCVSIDLGFDDVNIGGGVIYDPFDVIIWPLDGCRWNRFRDDDVFNARAAQAGAPLTVKIAAGDPSRAIRLTGADGAPRVRVTGPGGLTLDSTEEPGAELTPAIRILRSEQLKLTVVGLQDPKPGTYTIKELPGSPAIAEVAEAEDPPEARIAAQVDAPAAAAGSARAAAVAGARRTITYNIRKRPDQRVTFVETGPDGSRPIGTVNGGGRGTLSFTPAPGPGTRKIEAQFELAGLRAETVTVATFKPPSSRLGRPARVRVRRKASSLLVSWLRVAGATRYEIVTTLATGPQRKTSARRNTVRIKRVPRSSGGRVAVRATAPQRQGAVRTARFRATQRARTRFGALPRAPRGLKSRAAA